MRPFAVSKTATHCDLAVMLTVVMVVVLAVVVAVVALTTHELWPQRTNVALNAPLACINFGLQAPSSSFHRIPVSAR